MLAVESRKLAAMNLKRQSEADIEQLKEELDLALKDREELCELLEKVFNI